MVRSMWQQRGASITAAILLPAAQRASERLNNKRHPTLSAPTEWVRVWCALNNSRMASCRRRSPTHICNRRFLRWKNKYAACINISQFASTRQSTLFFILKYCAAAAGDDCWLHAPFKPFVSGRSAHPNPFDEYYAPPFVTMCAVDVTRLLTRLPSVSSGVCAIFHFGWTDNSIGLKKTCSVKRITNARHQQKCLSTADGLAD